MSDPTQEQAARCDALARQIAELDPNWASYGSAIFDAAGPTGWRIRWRLAHSDEWVDDDGYGETDISAPQAWARAVANGPDWRDNATLGALLLSLPWPQLEGNSNGKWWIETSPLRHDAPVFDGMAEAIPAAKVAQLETK